MKKQIAILAVFLCQWATAATHDLDVWVNKASLTCQVKSVYNQGYCSPYMSYEECGCSPYSGNCGSSVTKRTSVKLVLPALESLTKLGHGIEFRATSAKKGSCQLVNELQKQSAMHGGQVPAVLKVRRSREKKIHSVGSPYMYGYEQVCQEKMTETATIRFDNGLKLSSKKTKTLKGLPLSQCKVSQPESPYSE